MDALRVFLCHCSADKAAVRSLYQKLLSDGFLPWLDETDLLPGQDWNRAIQDAVRAADVVVVCLSKQSVTRAGYIQRELRFALQVAEEKPLGQIFVIPARLCECDVPKDLAGWHWVDLFSPNGYERLLASLRRRQKEKDSGESPVSGFASSTYVAFEEKTPRASGAGSFLWFSCHGHTPIEAEMAPRLLFEGDGTQFAEDLRSLVSSVLRGYHKLPRRTHIIVRGNRYDDGYEKQIYFDAHQTLAAGGIVLVTAFASWETFSAVELSEILPFDHIEQKFKENSRVSVTVGRKHKREIVWLDRPFDFINTYEILKPKRGTTVLLWQQKNIPLLGYRRFGNGLCIYFNACQHSCAGHMESPLTASPQLREVMSSLVSTAVYFHMVG